jgi:uncharacterized protein
VNGRARFVLDTDVLIDAICFQSSFGFRAYAKALDLGDVIVSSETFSELEDVVSRPKFDRFIAPHERRAVLAAISRDVHWFRSTIIINVCRDSTDDKFLELAVSAGATAIVSRDADLRALHPFRGIAIIDAKTFLEQDDWA